MAVPADGAAVEPLADLCWLISESWVPSLEANGQLVGDAQLERGVTVTLTLDVLNPSCLPRSMPTRARVSTERGFDNMTAAAGIDMNPDRTAAATPAELGASRKRLARIAGLLYLVVGIFGGFALGYVTPAVYVAGDAAATAANVLANAGLVRIGVVADLLQATVFVFLAMTLFLVLKHVDRNAATAMVILVAIATTMMCVNKVFQFAALRVVGDGSYPAAFGSAGSNALVLLLLDMHNYGFLIAQIFFGLWLIPLGYLAYKSGMFPRPLRIVLVVGGASYLVNMLARFLVPDVGERIHTYMAIPPTIAEVWMVGYLLVRGVKSSLAVDRAPATA